MRSVVTRSAIRSSALVSSRSANAVRSDRAASHTVFPQAQFPSGPVSSGARFRSARDAALQPTGNLTVPRYVARGCYRRLAGGSAGIAFRPWGSYDSVRFGATTCCRHSHQRDRALGLRLEEVAAESRRDQRAGGNRGRTAASAASSASAPAVRPRAGPLVGHCGGRFGSQGRSEAIKLVTEAVQGLSTLKSVHITGSLTDQGQTGTLDLQVASSAGLSGTIMYQGGAVKVIVLPTASTSTLTRRFWPRPPPSVVAPPELPYSSSRSTPASGSS